jgi:hypothetical protein
MALDDHIQDESFREKSVSKLMLQRSLDKTRLHHEIGSKDDEYIVRRQPLPLKEQVVSF